MYNPETLASEARTRMIKAIVTVAIFGILGGFIAIPAIIRSSKAMALANAGDFENAFNLYQSSKKFISWSIVVGVILIIAYIALVIYSFASEPDSYSYYNDYYYY